MPNITDLYASVPGTKVDWKIDWKEDAKADWKLDWDETPGDAPAVIIPRPTNTVLPAITGLAEVGESLVVSTGTWTDAGPFTFAWFADDVAISGEDGEELVLAEAQLGAVITASVTSTNVTGSTVAMAGPTAAVAAASGG